MRLLLLSFLSLLCALSQDIHAQTKTEFSLEDCIDFALKNNISVRQTELDVLSAQNDLINSKQQRYPNLNFSSGFRYNIGRSIDPFTNAFVEQDVNSQNLQLSSNVPIFSGLQIHNSIKRNELLVDLNSYALDELRNDVILNVVVLYTQILFNGELLEAAMVSKEATEALLEQTEKQVELGMLPKANQLNVESQLATDELNIVNAENDLELSKLQLKQALQIPAGQDFEIVVPEVDEPDVFNYPLSPADIYEIALSTMPEINRVRLDQQVAEYNIEIAEGQLLPSLSLSGSISTAYSSVAPDQIPRQGADNIERERVIGQVRGTGAEVVTTSFVPSEFTQNTYFNQLDFNRNIGLFLNLNIPIYNRYNVRSDINRAKLQNDNSKLQAESVKNVLRQEIEQAYYDARMASKTYQANSRRVESLQENYRALSTQYKLGATDVFSVNQVTSDLRAAQADVVRAKYDYILRLKILDFYQGKPIKL